MKKSFGFGSDGIASHFIKIAFPVISQSLCSIFNLSINTGKFPDCWKTSCVAPILKSGEHDDRSNYRPISVLPVVSRLFEKLIYDQLYNHLDKKISVHTSGRGGGPGGGSPPSFGEIFKNQPLSGKFLPLVGQKMLANNGLCVGPPP